MTRSRPSCGACERPMPARIVLVAPGRSRATSSAVALRLLARAGEDDERELAVVGDALTRSLAAEAGPGGLRRRRGRAQGRAGPAGDSRRSAEARTRRHPRRARPGDRGHGADPGGRCGRRQGRDARGRYRASGRRDSRGRRQAPALIAAAAAPALSWSRSPRHFWPWWSAGARWARSCCPRRR